MTAPLILNNGGCAPLAGVPELPFREFRNSILDGIQKGARLASLFGCPAGSSLRLLAVLAWKDTSKLSVVSTMVKDRYPALTPDCPQAHLFEREIAEQWNIEPTGHPWPKPVRFQPPREWSGSGTAPAGNDVCGVTDYFQVEGDEIHEVAVGPVHAGIIEPGHFRFQCHGETVHHLEISLGYQHRGIERAVTGGPDKRTVHYMETLAGDTTIGHTTAYCRNMETLTGTRVSARAQVIRGIALELERIANHIGDLGALAGDIGFLPTMSYCGRIRGDALNLSAMLCGSRFGRGLIKPGGVNFDMEPAIIDSMRQKLRLIVSETEAAVDLLWKSSSVLARFEIAGAIDRETARSIGLVGVAARACGLKQDVRHDFPYGIYQMAQIPVVTWQDGNVMARALVRWQEIEHSAAFIIDNLDALPGGQVSVDMGKAPEEPHLALALVEGWRGEICHTAVTGKAGQYQCYKVVDPSFHNWFGLALAMRGQQVSDFPLCNKSFNLSYCGYDL